MKRAILLGTMLLLFAFIFAGSASTSYAAPDLHIDKSVNNTTPNLGQSVNFTVTVTNRDNHDWAYNVRVTDQLPSNLTYVSHQASQGTYNATTGLWNVGTLEDDWDSATLRITAIANTVGTTTNRANTSCTGGNSDYDTATITVPPAADLRVTKTVDNSSPNYGQNVIFRINVTNAGPSNANNVRLTDVLPAGFIYQSSNASPGTSYNSGTGLWTIGNLNVGSVVSLNITALVNQTGNFINIANASGNQYDPNMTNNRANATGTVPPAADLRVTKNVNNTTPNYLDNVTFTVAVTNAGPNNATGVSLSDLLPAGLVWVSDNSGGAYNPATGVWTIGNLNVGSVVSLSISALVNATGFINNIANVSGAQYDQNMSNNIANASVTVPPAADIVVTKDVNNTAPNYLDNVTFTVIVRNDGPDDATGVSLSDLLPAGLVWVSDDSSGAYDHTTGVWTIGNLADGASRTLQIVAQVLGHNAIIDNVANASAIEYDPNLVNNRANVTVNVPAAADIAVTKTVNNATPDYLGNVVFTVTVTNNGPDDATGVKLSDLLPAGLVWISHIASQGSYDHVTGIWDIGDLYVEQGPVTLTITALVNQTGIITNVANGSSDLYDWNLTNNAANATVTTPQTSELVLSKTVDKTKVTVGETVRYLITVINNGPDAALNTVVTDNLPSGMQYLSSIASTGSYDPNTGLWTIGTMANGATETLEIFVKVLATGTYTNFATVSSSSSNPGTNSSDVVIEVIGDASGGGDETDGSVSMQDTGIPINLLVIALLTIVAGMVLPKRKN